MPNVIFCKVDVNLIDRARLFVGKQREDGTCPKYLDLVLVPRKTPGKYGDTHIVKQSATKEERQNRVEMPIIGSATEQAPRGAPSAQPSPSPFAPVQRATDDPDCPF